MSDFELPKDKITKNKAAEKLDEKSTEEGLPKKEKPKFSEDELNTIFDEIIFSGTYEEKVNIKNKLKVTFRTRTAEEIEDITKKIDATQANLISTITEKRSLMNIYYALKSYQGKDLSSAAIKQEEKEKFINKLPAPIIGVLMIALQNFDEKVYIACKDGEENF